MSTPTPPLKSQSERRADLLRLFLYHYKRGNLIRYDTTPHEAETFERIMQDLCDRSDAEFQFPLAPLSPLPEPLPEPETLTALPIDKTDENFAVRAEALLRHVFCGMHHVYSLKKEAGHWTCIHNGELSSYDNNYLTRLVFAAHFYCLRVWISQGGPRSLKIHVGRRYCRTGDMGTNHPSIETALRWWNQPKPGTADELHRR